MQLVMGVTPAGLEQQDTVTAIGGKTIRYRTACGTRTDYDIIVFRVFRKGKNVHLRSPLALRGRTVELKEV